MSRPPHWTGSALAALCFSIGLLQIIVLCTTFGVSLGSISDEGTIALQAMRVVNGQLAHRDYFIQTPIAGDVWVGTWFAIFGDSLESLRSFFLLEMGLLAASIQLLSCRLMPRGWSELPALMFLCNNPFCWYIPSPRWDAALFLVLALVQLITERRCLFAGVFVGLAALTQHPAGAAGCAGLILGLLWQRPSNWQCLRWLGWGILAVWFPYVLFLAYHKLVVVFFYDTIFFNLTQYVTAQSSKFSFHSVLENFRAAKDLWGNPAPFLKVSGYAIVDLGTYGLWFPMTAAGLILACYRRQRTLLCLTATLAFLTLLELVRPNRYHFQFHAPLLLIVAVYLALELGRLGRVWIGLLAVAHALVLWGHVQSKLASDLPVATPMGILYVDDPSQAKIWQEIIRVNDEFPPKEKLFVFPDDPLMQWLLGRGPVTREVAAFPCFYTFDQFEAIRADLQREKVENLCYVPMAYTPADYPGISPAVARRHEAWLVQYFTQGYLPYRSFAGITFYRRADLLRGQTNPNPKEPYTGEEPAHGNAVQKRFP